MDNSLHGLLNTYAITKAFADSRSRRNSDSYLKKLSSGMELLSNYHRSWSRLSIRLVSSLVDLCNIDHRFTTAYHPQTNGLTERFNKTLADMLSMYVDVEQKNWDEILPFVTFAYNTAKQETTGFTPFYLLHGREAETTLDTMLPFCPNDFDDNNITKIAARAEESATASPSAHSELKTKIVDVTIPNTKWYPTLPEISYGFILQ
ncbi:transposon Ty3-I Gag-Pol polyprotein [Trichonephila clavipes]|nr:transposon Ty3-I Gag-Pol polyprotein [Trichonephila clavipes]